MKLRVLLESSKYTKFRQYLWGLKPSQGLAIMTPENPNSKSLTKAENEKLMKTGEKLLKEGKRLSKDGKEIPNKRYSYLKQKGMYGQRENSLIVYDISSDDAVEIGKGWVQDSIIVITPGNLEKRTKPLFHMVRINENSTWLNVSDILVENIKELTDTAEMFSQIGNKKYEIPFFGDDAVEVDNDTHSVSDNKNKVQKQA